MIYMLDTNIISYLIKKRDSSLIDRFESFSKEHTIAISSISAAELFYGVKKRESVKLEVAVREFLYPLAKLPFGTNAAYEYGCIRAALEKKGEVIGAYDMLIAAHAKSLDAILVTNNTREFKRVEGLVLEDWTKL